MKFIKILEYLVAQKSEEGEHPGHNDRDDREPSGVLYPRQRRSGDGGADYGFPQLRLLRFFCGAESLGMRYKIGRASCRERVLRLV